MIQGAVLRDPGRINLLDYALSALGAILAVYSVSMGVSQPGLIWIFGSGILVGTALSFLASRSLTGWWSRLDGPLYAVAAFSAFIFVRTFNQVLPTNPFEARELIVASVLLWMLTLGSFAIWRDQTLLFQAVPCIALFGLVGVWDTWQPAPFLFFGFLLCLATTFARAHVRLMLRLAQESGFDSAEAAAQSPTRREGWLENVRSGPWRWVAGPEWALASGLVVVLISLLGAPVLQETAKPIAGAFRVNVPLPRPQAAAPALFSSTEGSVSVGNGPISLSERPVVRARLDRARYLRSATYDRYGGRGWRTTAAMLSEGSGQARRQMVEGIRPARGFEWTVEVLAGTGGRVPVPGEATRASRVQNVRQQPDGTFAIIGATGQLGLPPMSGRSVEATDEFSATDAVRDVPPPLAETTNADLVPERVYQLARQATVGAGNDMERALRIKREIEGRVRYNLRAPATPANVDVVEHFLFTSREGYCDLFASSMVLMARSVGIPARYVTGYYPTSGQRDDQGNFIIREADGHAWAELWFENVGWVVFDATEGAEQVAGGEVGGATETGAWYERPWVRRLLDGSILLALVGGGWFAVRLARRRVAPEQVLRVRLERLYVEFASVLAKRTGQRRQLSQTPDEYLAAAVDHLNGEGEAAKDLNDRFVRAMYSPVAPDDAVLKEIEDDLKTWRRSVSSAPKSPKGGKGPTPQRGQAAVMMEEPSESKLPR